MCPGARRSMRSLPEVREKPVTMREMANLALTRPGDGRIFHPRLWSKLSDLEEIAGVELAEKAALLRQALLQRGRRVVVTVSSGSMEPTLRPGDRVTVERVEPAGLRWGDIVLYESPLAGLVVHRLIWTVPPLARPRSIYTKGDALPYLDRPCPADGVLGRVIEIQAGRRRRKIRRTTAYLGWVAAAARWCMDRGPSGNGRTASDHGENQ